MKHCELYRARGHSFADVSGIHPIVSHVSLPIHVSFYFLSQPRGIGVSSVLHVNVSGDAYRAICQTAPCVGAHLRTHMVMRSVISLGASLGVSSLTELVFPALPDGGASRTTVARPAVTNNKT